MKQTPKAALLAMLCLHWLILLPPNSIIAIVPFFVLAWMCIWIVLSVLILLVRPHVESVREPKAPESTRRVRGTHTHKRKSYRK